MSGVTLGHVICNRAALTQRAGCTKALLHLCFNNVRCRGAPAPDQVSQRGGSHLHRHRLCCGVEHLSQIPGKDCGLGSIFSKQLHSTRHVKRYGIARLSQAGNLTEDHRMECILLQC